MSARKSVVRLWSARTLAALLVAALLWWGVPAVLRRVGAWRQKRVARAIVSIRGARRVRALTGQEALALGEVHEFGRLHTRPDVRRALECYKQAARSGVPEGSRRAGMLAFDKLGDPLRALRLLTDAVKAGCVPAVVDIGCVYAAGVWPAWFPDAVAARSMFELAAQRGDARTRRQALLHLAETVGSFWEEPAEGGSGRRIPLDYTFEVRAALVQPVDNMRQDDPGDEAVLRRAAAGQRRAARADATLPAIVQAALDTLPVIVGRGGSQNVHDTLALNAAQQALQRIAGEAQGGIGQAHVGAGPLSDVRTLVGSHIDACGYADQVKHDARRVLGLVDDSAHSRVGVSQLDALRRVWDRIHNPVNADRRDDMKDSLVQMLASGVEDGVAVCATGRLMRIVGALDGTDAEDIVSLKPTWAVDAELGSLSAAIRQRVLDEAPAADRLAYEQDAGTQSAGAALLFDAMRDELVAKASSDYVAPGLMTQDALDIRLQPYLEALEP